ncbi:helix-turn-helix transcriptional regulator [Streptomyces cadmiisoli]|uniref:helix-turn-helix transcriptional regulator n=1 Tax=Streptomyces cadmiisoli TaxID=2184053 RepID=UPI00365FB268
MLLHRALLEYAHGRVLHRMGLATEAARWFDEARQRLRRMRARPFLERCADDIPAPSRVPSGTRSTVSGRPFRLTDRERDIAHLIGRGLTNKEIASELFVSPKTVEYHLSHIYEKFGLGNRRELRDRVQRGALTEENF